MRWAAILLLVTCAAVSGQQPSSRPADTVESLRRQLAELRSVVAMLRAENADLKAKLADKARASPAISVSPMSPITAAIKAHKVIAGMSRDEVAQSLNHLRGVGLWNVGWDRTSSTDGGDVETWRITNGGTSNPTLVREVVVEYDTDGKAKRATQKVFDTFYEEPDFKQ